MAGYVNRALFIYSTEGEQYREQVENNTAGTRITSIAVQELADNQEAITRADHAVVCGELNDIKTVLELAQKYGFSVGILPLSRQKKLVRSYRLPVKTDDALLLALQNSPHLMDLVFCNDTVLLFKGSFGRVPLVDNAKGTRLHKIILRGIKRLFTLKLLPVTITTLGTNETTINTAVSGVLIFENSEQSFATGLIDHEYSCVDEMVSMLLIAPFSIVAYLQLMLYRLSAPAKAGRILPSVGFIKSRHFRLDSKQDFRLTVDDETKISTPIECRVVPAAVRVNHGCEAPAEQTADTGKEKTIIHSLPAGKELLKAQHKRVPFFTYASEERFRDLFKALRADAKIDSIYIVLMLLSTMLASVGLYLNSSSVIIGAMLLAPLMAPIISMAMSLLRNERILFRNSFYKIALGVALALSVGAILTLISPYQPFTQEMAARLNPSVLDLMVAIVAGIAGAYTKSYKEILQSLAGVAIAVALVPPLAVAGIGLGRGDLYFFGQAFLLFSTNLIGIIISATLTFRMLGFSPVVRHRRGVLIVILSFFLISIPLYLAYDEIVFQTRFEKSWQKERFLVNEKYLIVKQAKLTKFRDRKILTVEIYAREPLSRFDLTEFRRKVVQNFPYDLEIRAKIIYIP